MTVITTAGAIAAIAASGSAYLFRRSISRKWINFRSSPPHDLHGKLYIITGGNTGLGYETAKDISRRNGTVLLACRDIAKAQDAARSIISETGNSNVDCVELDLSSLASVRKFISNIKSKYKTIDALVCNAGVWVPMEQQSKTKDGYEIHFGINHLGHFMIATNLIDQLARSSGGRIIFVTSSLMKSGNINMETKDFIYGGRNLVGGDGDEQQQRKKASSYGPPTAYSDAKLMNAVTCKYLAKTILPSNVSTYSVCPGFCRSSLGRNVSIPWYAKFIVTPLMLLIQRTTIQGSQNIIFATIEDDKKLVNGAIYCDGEIQTEQMELVDSLGSDLPKQLYDLSKELIGKVEEERQ